MHDGGVVPGSAGQEKLAILEAGETVIPADKSAAMRGGGPTTIVLKGDGSALANALILILQNAIDDRGGDVQVVLGR
jgi:hypothetical protein